MDIPNFIDEVKKSSYLNKNTGLIVTAGFEDRNLAVMERIKTASLPIKKVIVLDYENKNDNEPIRSKIIKEANVISKSIEMLEIDRISELPNLLKAVEIDRLLVDIAGMTRVLIFQVLNILDKNDVAYDIVYTEAETYFPLRSFYDRLMENVPDKEAAFSKYLEHERAEFVYSYDCDIVQLDEFFGNPEPGNPAMIMTFFTFKRSRLQAILQSLELEKKLFILSEPVRSELKWRKEFMEIANLDLIHKNEPYVQVLNTLNPFKLLCFLDEKTYKNRDYSRFNLILAPLGSKMQTVGSYFYWKKHPEVSVIFSQPRSYYSNAYSEGYKDTFIITSEIIKQYAMCRDKI